ncbi:NADPH2:quinone reductase [Pseudomonas cedrina]|uniref:Zn-dependent oxidoreductase n=2 Tax=Pseudomonas cedrina TaxID=651740 RepID=A0A1V2JY33_PSECE|nr:quinone oxidoreductase [Pseudomonas cedrina]ONH50110.1 Zn-dependent oxidoreductase [Pseudomonas cedrina subsp. cedrina]SDS24804.1 NADPH2:quinone reductase [Pseudomonas cedrina]
MNQRIRIYQQGTPDVLNHETFELEPPSHGQVLIRHEAIGVNFVDTMFRDGTFKVALPFGMGVEAAGIVEAIGDGVKHLKVGDRVAYFFAFGAYADRRVIDASALIKLPDDISTEQAAGLLSKGLTAWALVRQVHGVQAGETVVVHGASGGVGSLLVRWVKSLGATVIATVGSASKAAIVQSWGLDHVLHADEPDLAKRIKAKNGGFGVDVVYDLVGRDTLDASINVLRDGGDLIHVGNASGGVTADTALLAAHGIRYVQPSTPQYVNANNQDMAASELFERFREGALGSVELSRYRLEDASLAHQAIASRKHIGSILLIP